LLLAFVPFALHESPESLMKVSMTQAEREAAEDDLKSICFVCNVSRFRADQDGIGFDKHIKVIYVPFHDHACMHFSFISAQRPAWTPCYPCLHADA